MAADSITSPRIGFQGSVRRLGSRAVPQYFVMVGGGAHDRGATFARLAAKMPARRIPQVVERLIDLYARERQPDESATAFFGRVELDVVKRDARGSRAAAAAAMRCRPISSTSAKPPSSRRR